VSDSLARVADDCDNLPEGVGGAPSANRRKNQARTSGSLSPPKRGEGWRVERVTAVIQRDRNRGNEMSQLYAKANSSGKPIGRARLPPSLPSPNFHKTARYRPWPSGKTPKAMKETGKLPVLGFPLNLRKGRWTQKYHGDGRDRIGIGRISAQLLPSRVFTKDIPRFVAAHHIVMDSQVD
jgi:hypothetical protein